MNVTIAYCNIYLTIITLIVKYSAVAHVALQLHHNLVQIIRDGILN